MYIDVYRSDRNTVHASGSVAFIIKRNIAQSQLTNDDVANLEIVGAKIQTTDIGFINIYSAYTQPNKAMLESDVKLIFNTVQPTFLIGDLNLKNTI